MSHCTGEKKLNRMEHRIIIDEIELKNESCGIGIKLEYKKSEWKDIYCQVSYNYVQTVCKYHTDG